MGGVFIPKIIENLKEALIEETRRQIDLGGYSSVTVRSVARGVGVAVGTLYNYFPSKDILVASYILADWQAALAYIKGAVLSNPTFDTAFDTLYTTLSSFISEHDKVFSDAAAMRVFYGAFAERHKLLREQITAAIYPAFSAFSDGDFRAEFVAEAMLSWSGENRSREELYSMLSRIAK